MPRSPSYRLFRYLYVNGTDKDREFMQFILEHERIKRGMGGRCR
jgi:hypothetical protein